MGEHRKAAEQSFAVAEVHALLAIERRLAELVYDLRARVPHLEPL